jgi:hypothetical protein
MTRPFTWLALLALGCGSAKSPAETGATAPPTGTEDTSTVDTEDTQLDTEDTQLDTEYTQVDTEDTEDTEDTAPPPEPVDPLALAAEVSADEIELTIAELEAFGTRYTATDGDDQARAYLVLRLQDLGIDTETDPFTFGANESANVIGRKAGAVEPDVVYIFSAHYDSTSTDPLNTAPGADDNASGVAAVLEAARLLADVPTRYSVWFVFTGAEEQGSVGSEHMVGWLDAEGVDVRGVMAPDMIGYWPLGDGDAMDILGDEESEHLVTGVAAIADALGVAHKDWIQHSYCYGDDHTNFQEAGYPAITPMDCVEAHNVPAAGESLPHYHKTTDTLDTVHLPFTTRVVQVLVASFATWAEPVVPE